MASMCGSSKSHPALTTSSFYRPGAYPYQVGRAHIYAPACMYVCVRELSPRGVIQFYILVLSARAFSFSLPCARRLSFVLHARVYFSSRGFFFFFFFFFKGWDYEGHEYLKQKFSGFNIAELVYSLM